MDADGSNATRLGTTFAELTAAECITCDGSFLAAGAVSAS